MKKLLIVLLIYTCQGFSADIRYASRLLDFSSSLGGKQYNPQQVLGRPNAAFGEKSPNAWLPKSANSSSEYLLVGFDTLMPIRQVAVFENLNPGAIKSIILTSELGKDYTVYKGSTGSVNESSRIFRVTFDLTPYNVRTVRVNFDFSKYDGQKQIDAIAISNDVAPIEIKINTIQFSGPLPKPENLGRRINSSFTEVGPVISPDGKTLFFCRKDHPDNINGADANDDIWFSRLNEDGTWGPAENMDVPLNNEYNNFVEAVRPDGNQLLLGNHYFRTEEDRKGQEVNGISMSYRMGKTWSFPRNIAIRNFKNYDPYVNYYLSNDGKVILMGIEHDDTYGVADLYVSFYENDTTFSAPKNLGPIINTTGSEGTPFLAADGVTLYYTTDGLPGFGSSDVYMSKRLDDTWQRWSEPINIGPPINTSGWDAYYTIPASGDYAYFVSSNNSLGNTDIFRIKLPKEVKPEPVVLVSGKVINEKTGQPMAAVISYQTLPDGKDAGSARSDADSGSYKIVLPAGKKYGWIALADGFYSVSENFSTDSLKEYSEINKDVHMIPVVVGQTIRLNNIFFDFAKADLREESFPELDRLVRLMTDHSSMKISIDGHTDDVGSDPDNQVLSFNRAKSVVNYLISKSISSDRLKYNGYGESRPLNPNDSEEHRQWNRRVEFTILSE